MIVLEVEKRDAELTQVHGAVLGLGAHTLMQRVVKRAFETLARFGRIEDYHLGE